MPQIDTRPAPHVAAATAHARPVARSTIGDHRGRRLGRARVRGRVPLGLLAAARWRGPGRGCSPTARRAPPIRCRARCVRIVVAAGAHRGGRRSPDGAAARQHPHRDQPGDRSVPPQHRRAVRGRGRVARPGQRSAAMPRRPLSVDPGGDGTGRRAARGLHAAARRPEPPLRAARRRAASCRRSSVSACSSR